ncbi:MAG: flagellar basal-body rod protein FlgG [Luminiphilus sp.]|jgi:flagellar basal-body rod protein FlgG|nr:flagellar basal-body rod protein FlgG [Luminiphilus sp.]|tara:strand:- start:1984 stop:2769 length:786 start_codon:yes stop_codon:yes gene_type:complete
MNQSLWISKTGLDAQQTKMSTISNNLANVGTTGFKRGRAIFEDLLYQNVRQVGAQSSQDTVLPSGLQVGTGTRVVATERLFTQGNLTKTDNALDIAIQGRGFFEILMPDGTQGYTRDGSFHINDQGLVVTSAGYQLQPPITVPADAMSITVAGDGTVSVQQPGTPAATQIGTVQLNDFINPAGLQARGENLFMESGASGAPQPGNPGLNGLGTLAQGYVESSNVNVVEELVNMIETQRAYEMNSKAISTADQMLQYVSQNL